MSLYVLDQAGILPNPEMPLDISYNEDTRMN